MIKVIHNYRENIYTRKVIVEIFINYLKLILSE